MCGEAERSDNGWRISVIGISPHRTPSPQSVAGTVFLPRLLTVPNGSSNVLKPQLPTFSGRWISWETLPFTKDVVIRSQFSTIIHGSLSVYRHAQINNMRR
jgi:hypothetical protein